MTVRNKMDLICDIGKVAGERYHTVKPEITLWELGKHNNWHDMVEWCVNTFGPTPKDGVWSSGHRWYVNNAKFWFKSEEDRTWFVLRWS